MRRSTLVLLFAALGCAVPRAPPPAPAPPPPPPPTASASAAPVDPPARVKIAAGRAHACALFEGGRLHCWGSNEFGQLGAGAGPASTRAVAVKTPAELVEIAAGDAFTCGGGQPGRSTSSAPAFARSARAA